MELMKILPLNELKKKIKQLQTEKTHLTEEINKLRLEANGKALRLEKETGSLREEAESLRELITA